jgi:hypothetical protein
MPTAGAIQWVEVTTPKVPTISGRVVNGLGLISFKGAVSQPAICRVGLRLSAAVCQAGPCRPDEGAS